MASDTPPADAADAGREGLMDDLDALERLARDALVARAAVQDPQADDDYIQHLMDLQSYAVAVHPNAVLALIERVRQLELLPFARGGVPWVEWKAWRDAVRERARLERDVDVYTPGDLYADYTRAVRSEVEAALTLRAAVAGDGKEGQWWHSRPG